MASRPLPARSKTKRVLPYDVDFAGLDEDREDYGHFFIFMNVFFAIRVWALVAIAIPKISRVSYSALSILIVFEITHLWCISSGFRLIGSGPLPGHRSLTYLVFIFKLFKLVLTSHTTTRGCSHQPTNFKSATHTFAF